MGHVKHQARGGLAGLRGRHMSAVAVRAQHSPGGRLVHGQ